MQGRKPKKDRKLTKLEQNVCDYLKAECRRLEKAHEFYRTTKPKNAQERTFFKMSRMEIGAQIHNLRTVSDVVHDIFSTGRGFTKKELAETWHRDCSWV